MIEVKQHAFPGIFTLRENDRTYLATRTLVPGQRVYGERTIRVDESEYRVWSPRKSKLAAAIRKGIREMPIQRGSTILYLGAASGTTVSHISDIVGESGTIYAVEFSPRVARALFQLARSRPNIVPIVEDARHPTRYAPLIGEPIDIVYQDVAQPEQASILYDNMSSFCSMGSWGMVAIKARSIDSSADTDTIYVRELARMDELGLDVIETINLHPLQRDHSFVVVRLRGGF